MTSGAADHAIGFDAAAAIMDAFTARTGVVGQAPDRRYLWTDAFALENELALVARTGDPRVVHRAEELIAHVHRVLGHHRGDDGRTGPLGGGTEEEAARHPTRGGLRIGKPLRERTEHEPHDEALEQERDGQYFHYATRWMDALSHAGRRLARPELFRWARELAVVQHRAFVQRGAGRPQMVWKASIDLTRPLVRSPGMHDALDGLVSYARLERAGGDGPSLREALEDFASMIDRTLLPTADPLGIGMMLVHAYRLEEMASDPLLALAPIGASDLVEASLAGLEAYLETGALDRPLGERLPFRELGLAIGLHAFERMRPEPADPSSRARSLHDALDGYVDLADELERTWLGPAGRHAIASSAHRDIDEVMLASALLPEGCLAADPHPPSTTVA